MTQRKTWLMLAVPFLLFGLGACSSDGPTSPDDSSSLSSEETVLLSVAPEGGSTAVGMNTAITVEFSHPMNPDMSQYADVHKGEITGAEVAGAWEWFEDDTVLRFTPAQPLEPGTDYVVHLGGGMMDADGEHVNVEQHGQQMGGEWATDDMMTGRGMGGGMGGGMDSSEHMGGSWDHPSNGSHGMVFTFTTAG